MRDWRGAFTGIAADLAAARRSSALAPPRPEVVHAWRLLERSRGRLPVHAVARRVGLTQRHLSTLFAREVGRSPKEVAMLLRFEAATGAIAAEVRRRGRPDLAGVAAACGYSDQAHLTREFTRFAGTSPTRWVAEEFRNIQDGGHSLAAR